MCRGCLSAASQIWNLWRRYKHHLLRTVFVSTVCYPCAGLILYIHHSSDPSAIFAQRRKDHVADTCGVRSWWRSSHRQLWCWHAQIAAARQRWSLIRAWGTSLWSGELQDSCSSSLTVHLTVGRNIRNLGVTTKSGSFLSGDPTLADDLLTSWGRYASFPEQ